MLSAHQSLFKPTTFVWHDCSPAHTESTYPTVTPLSKATYTSTMPHSPHSTTANPDHTQIRSPLALVTQLIPPTTPGAFSYPTLQAAVHHQIHALPVSLAAVGRGGGGVRRIQCGGGVARRADANHRQEDEHDGGILPPFPSSAPLVERKHQKRLASLRRSQASPPPAPSRLRRLRSRWRYIPPPA